MLHCCLHMHHVSMTLAGEACKQRPLRACTLCSVVNTAPLGAKASRLSVRIGIATMPEDCNTQNFNGAVCKMLRQGHGVLHSKSMSIAKSGL